MRVGFLNCNSLNIVCFSLLVFLFIIFVCPATWAASYYVDKNNSKASDSNPGTEASPWKTIQQGANIAEAGDTIYVKSGIYYEWVDVKNSGIAGEPIIFKAYPGAHPIIDGSKTTIKKSYHGLFNSRNKSYITVDGFEVRNSNAFLIRLSYGDDLTIKNCIAHDNTDAAGSLNGQSGIFIDHCNAGLVEHNEVYHTGGNCINADSTNNVTIQHNYVHDNPAHNGINVFPKTTEAQIDYTGNNIKYNIITGCTNGIYLRHQTNNVIIGNLIYNNVHSNKAGIYYSSHPDDSSKVNSYTKIYNNTIVGNTNYGIENTHANYLTIQNNIIAYNGREISISSGVTRGHNIDSNLYSPSSRFRWGSSTYTSLASWISASKQDFNSSEADPNFTNRSGNDYSLTSNSKSAIDKGLDLSSFGITKDLNGNSRPQGSGFDIGAYEYTPGDGSISKLDNPINLRILLQ